MAKPLVSICIPIYNGEQYLAECIDSVLKQGIDDCEIIVVDDVSTDRSIQIVKDFQKQSPQIKLHKNEKNLGLVGNWNKCLELANGEWIKFVFQDDILADDCINKMLETSKERSFVACDREFIFDDLVSEETKNYFNNKLLKLSSLVKSKPAIYLSNKTISNIAASHIYLNFIGEPTAVMFKKSLVNEVGLFNANLFQICDLEYWLRIVTAKGLVFIPQKLISFRVHANSTTSRNLTGNKNFRANYFDVVILAHDLLFNKSFAAFRNCITYFQKKKIQLFLQIKMYEAQIAFKNSSTVEPFLMEELIRNYPQLQDFMNVSLRTKIIYKLLLFKRKLI